jgi:hypothetical protein
MPDPHDDHDHPGYTPGMGWLLNAERMAQQQQAIQAATQQVAMAQAAAMEAASMAAVQPNVQNTVSAVTALQEVVAAHTAQLAAHQNTLNMITAVLTTKPPT